MILLSLDQATTTGFAVGAPGCERPEWGVVRFKVDAPGECLSRFSFWLRERLNELRPTAVWRESVYFPRPAAKGPPINIATLARLLAMAETVDALCFEHGIRDCYEVTPAEVSSAFLGYRPKAGQKKRAYIDMARRYGCETVSTDAADALAIWFMAEAHIDPVAAQRRRAGIGAELNLHPQTRSAPQLVTAARPKPSDDEASNGCTENSLFGREIPVVGGNRARKIA